MALDSYQLAQVLTLAGLIGGTAEYSYIIRRRAVRDDAFREATHAAGLRGLVRVMVVDPEAARAQTARRSGR